MKKSIVPPRYRHARIGGQVPSKENLEALRLMQKPAPTFKAAMLLEHDEPVLRIEGITKGLGFDAVKENSWNKFLDDQLNGNVNELVMRKALYERMMGERMDPALRKAIFQRSMTYRRGKMQKSVVQIVTPDEILEKAEARGGSYHRRVPKKSGKGFHYIYDPEKYDTREDAHISGKDATAARVKKAVTTAVSESEKGCSLDDMKAVARKHGSTEVAASLKKQCCDGGEMQYKGGRFTMRKQPAEKSQGKLKKSLKPDFKFIIGDDDV